MRISSYIRYYGHWVIWAIVGIYLAIMLGMGLGQRSFIYHPDPTVLPAPESLGLRRFEPISLTAEDGVKLRAWYSKPLLLDALVVVYFPGNSKTLADRAGRLHALQSLGVGVLALSYRGYGGSEGEPTEQGLYADARAALAYLAAQGIDTYRIVLVGESLGTGVATQMAQEVSPRALVLDSPFTSVADRAQELYPWLPARWMVKDRYDNETKINHIRCPILIIHGTEDTVIPVEHSEILREKTMAPTIMKIIPKLGHVGLQPAELAATMRNFLSLR